MDGGNILVNYLISVITPFHNTKKELIQKGMISLQNQTIGFENIEWIITVHNSEQKYLDDVNELTAGFDNIKVLELHTPERTPSVPRNYCLDNATGKYVAFMDSDDSFNVDAFEKIYSFMEDNGAEMASFRAEIETEDRNVIRFMDVRAPYEQIDDCYVLEKNDPRRGMLLFGGNATVWSKMINREFLEKNNIRFNKEVTIGEDGLFCLNCYKYAKKVLLLPHVIGYRYYMNHGSLAQNTVNAFHTSESIRSLTNNCTDILDAALDANISLYYVGWGVGGLLAQSLMISPDLSQEDRQYVQEKMLPYIKQFPELTNDGKIYTDENAKQTMDFVKAFLLGESGEKGDYFSTVLLPIISSNANTEIGKKYSFASIKTPEEYESIVPLSDYSFYKPIVDIMTKVGESGIITREKVVSYSKTKDQYGNTIYIPQTEKFAAFYQNIYLNYINKAQSSTFAMLESKVDKTEINNDGSYYSDMKAALLEGLKDIDIYNSHSRRFKFGTVTSPRELIFSGRNADFTYTRLLFALADRDVSQILAPFTVDVLDTMKCLENNWKQLVKDLFIGVVSEASGLDLTEREILSAMLEADPDRAMEIAEICREGFENIVTRIWPNIELIIAAGTGRFAYETKELKYYIGNIALDNGYLMSSEAVIAKSYEVNSDLYVLVQNSAYMEFIPADECDKCVRYENLEVDKIYEVVITNSAGLYRYKSGISIKVVNIENGSVIVKYVINLG